MKKIYVTVAEFLENGGEMLTGRRVYLSEYGYTPTVHGLFDELVDGDVFFTSEVSDNQLVKNTHDCYVEIDATPHYV